MTNNLLQMPALIIRKYSEKKLAWRFWKIGGGQFETKKIKAHYFRIPSKCTSFIIYRPTDTTHTVCKLLILGAVNNF